MINGARARQLAYVRAAMKATGLDATGLSRKSGLSPSTLNRPLNDENWPHDLSLKTLQAIARASGVPIPADLLAPEAPEMPELGDPLDLSRLRRLPPEPHPSSQKHIPVLGITLGSEEGGDFTMNGEAIQRVPVPAALANITGIFALWVQGDSMWPRYRHGEMVLVGSHKPAAPDDHVVVELHPPQEGAGAPCYLKRLVRRTATEVILAQYNPPKEIRIPVRKVRQIYRIIPQDEQVRA